MASLLTLPAELLVLILEHVGGRELRRSQTGKTKQSGPGWRATDKLILCREWYAAARPVFLSGLHVSELRLYGCNLDRLDGELSYKASRHLMHKNTRSLSIRLLGHYWDLNSAEDLERWHAEDSWSGSAPLNDMPPDFEIPSENRQLALERWRDEEMRPKLDELFDDLRQFSVLKYLDFTASSEGLDWNYIHLSTISRMLNNLPITQNLRTLVLDTAGTRLGDDDDPTHLCEEVARVLPYIENVRLRMITICPAIFEIDGHAEGRHVALKTLIIKLHLPDAFDHTSDAEAEPCGMHPDPLFLCMTDEAPFLMRRLARLRGHNCSDYSFVEKLKHGMTGFAISYRYYPPGSPPLTVSPIITMDCFNRTLIESSSPTWPPADDDGEPRWLELVANEANIY
ncbi:hypothetical protein BST61_g9262 [Cercospora zeina]